MSNTNLDINYRKEAFMQPWNLTYLTMMMMVALVASVFGLSAVTDLVMLAALGGELMYLGMFPQNQRFQRAIRAKKNAELSKPKSEKERFQMLSKQSQKRYVRLSNLEKQIASNYKKLSSASQGLLDSHIKKIDGLLESYLGMLFSKERYAYLKQDGRQEQISKSIRDLRVDMEDDPPKVRSIKARRLKILEKRLDELKRSQENEEIIDAQMETIEDVIKYIHEQSLTMKNPEEITFQLDTLLEEVEITQASVVELEDVFNMSPGGLLNDMDSYGLEESGSSSTQERVKE